MKTYFVKQKIVNKKWLLVDAKNQILGKLASQITKILRGKHKIDYTPYIDCGDNIVVINAKYIKVTGKKMVDKIYYNHTGYPGGIKKKRLYELIKGQFPEKVLKISVKRMMPSNSILANKQIKNLYIYPESEHRHQGQKPILQKILR